MSEWKEYQLSEIMELIGGGTPKTTVPKYWDGNIPWLSVTDFNTGKKYCFDAVKKITERGLRESSTKILKKGQIIISVRGTVGVLSVLCRDMAFNQSCYGINAEKNLTSNAFLYYILKDNIASLQSASYGAVFDTITKETFSHIAVSLPPSPRTARHRLCSFQPRRQDRPAPPPEQDAGSHGGNAFKNHLHGPGPRGQCGCLR